jgi:hypothetical protein
VDLWRLVNLEPDHHCKQGEVHLRVLWGIMDSSEDSIRVRKEILTRLRDLPAAAK